MAIRNEAEQVLALVGVIVAGVCREQALAVGHLADLRETLVPIWQQRLDECRRLAGDAAPKAQDRLLAATVLGVLRTATEACA